ncbi:response regulator transcription factor [Dyadobacter sp. CY107]|uniref:response regulator n=1 Tax=Dyadobacter fanqingshengii TaxID=2906443 RepID=UPI001F208278|nr:response regulator transcription factor [Dyadobacter fanqingshengii]MCF2502725.1 response regulator transcription factor [Dyadobacter fanqingshengii]
MNQSKPTKVLLVDDHHIFNDGLKRLINEQADMTVCGQVFQAKDVLFAVQGINPQLILLDINLQGTNGIDLGKKLLELHPNLKIILLTMYNQPRLIDETRKAGLHGYLLKDATTPELLHEIRTVLSGQTSFDIYPSGYAQTTDVIFQDNFAQRLNLTFREVEIIRLIMDGLTNEEIGDRLHVSFFTVKTHRRNIYFKLGFTNVAELIQFASKYGL